MTSLTSKEFFDQLKSNTLKPSYSIKGLVKKSDNDSEVLFARKGRFTNWVKIPSTMVESAVILKSFSKNNETCTVVKLHLKTPTTPEGKVFSELLSAMGGVESGKGREEFSMGREGSIEHTCHCGCHSCNCGGHHHYDFGGNNHCSCHS